MEPVRIAFLWHMHQPYYKNLSTGEYLLPWVLLHGTKDYLDMASMLQDFPGMKQNFNVVPSLLAQLLEYQDLQVKDTFLQIFRKPPEDLSEAEEDFLVMNFFSANWDNMIKPFPRYYELLRKRGFYYPKQGIKAIKEYFTDDDLRDLQILFYLSWVDPGFFGQYDGLSYLKSKGRGFIEEDKEILGNVQKDILKRIIPLYKQLAVDGVIEISTSPYYHPIIPLLIDGRVATEALPGIRLPERSFLRPEDAAHQIRSALDYFSATFGMTPEGMWPPEGSVSDAALEAYMDHGVKWLATDEDILYQSLRFEARRDDRGTLASPDILYKPYKFIRGDKEISMIFRDQALSDLISFHYSKSDPKEAATDCVNRIKRAGEALGGRVHKPLITIAMDGENAWENYVNDGRDFLSYLYEGILKEPAIIPTTISEHLREGADYGVLHHSFSGSWIGHNFAIWIGHVEDNTGWDLLAETRDLLEKEDPERKNSAAWESIYIAEGSDWFWWYGDEHSSENDDIFDFLFRENLSNVYRFLGKEPLEVLSIPIMMEDREVLPTTEPVNFIHPTIDGEVTSYFDWMGAGFLEGKGHGVAMHDAVTLIKGCHFGFDERNLYLRLDINKGFVQNMEACSFEINLIGSETFKVVYRVRDGAVEGSLPIKAAFKEAFEMVVSFDSLGVKCNDKVGIWCSLKLDEMNVDRIPKRGYFPVKVPSELFEAEMWYV